LLLARAKDPHALEPEEEPRYALHPGEESGT
jgi:hypothetical protein